MSSDDISKDVVIRSASQQDLPGIFCLTEEAHFYSSMEMLSALLKCAGDGNFIVAEYGGRLIGCRITILLDERTACVGYFIVTEQFRGTKVAKRIASRVLEIVSDRNLVIWSVADRVQANLKLGMKITAGCFCSIMYCKGKIDTSKLNPDDLTDDATRPTFKIVNQNEIDFEQLFRYDTSIHGTPRRHILEKWLTKASTITMVAVADDGTIMGYGVVQESSHNFNIAPLYAESSAAMASLLKALVEAIPETSELDLFANTACLFAGKVLEDNKDRLLQIQEMKLMFNKEDIHMPHQERVFGVISPLFPV